MEVIEYSKIGRAITEATKIGEIKEIRARLEALIKYRKKNYADAFKLVCFLIEAALKHIEIYDSLENKRQNGQWEAPNCSQELIGWDEAGFAYENEPVRLRKIRNIVDEENRRVYYEEYRLNNKLPSFQGLLALARYLTPDDEIDLPEGKFSVIYADPPWPIQSMDLGKWDSLLDDKYKTLSLEKIKDMKVQDITADDCSLFLWTTHTFLKQAFEVIEAWGFKYHCCITWDKVSGWSLNGFHRRTEFCLYAYKGKINVSQTGEFIPTLIMENAKEHSRKPQIMDELIIKHTPEPRVELFARKKKDGFIPWGNQLKDD